MESTISGEPYAPDQIARLVEKAGVRKATLAECYKTAAFDGINRLE